jgi:hypothetical protein
MIWPDAPAGYPDARVHAMLILEVLDGDWQEALDQLWVLRHQYDEKYLKRLEACLRPQGEA